MASGDKPKRLSPSSIYHIACDVKKGEADPEKARELLIDFCERYGTNEAIPPDLYKHIYDAFKSCLDDGKSLDAAFGLKRKKGRPAVDQHSLWELAAGVLRLRMEGLSAEDAVIEVSETRYISETQVWEAWRKNKLDALILLRLERPHDSYPWSEEEVTRLTELFSKEDWFIPPE